MKKTVQDFFRKGDMVLLGLCLAASGFGLLLIYSATRYLHNGNRYVMIQGIGILIGVVAYVVFTLVDIELFTEKMWKWMLLFNVAILLALIPFGRAGDSGNKNWIPIPGLPINIQPAEVVKLFLVLLLAYQCAKLKEKELLAHPLSVILIAAHGFFFAGLNLVISKDYGMSLLYILMLIIIMWCAGVKWGWFALGIGGAVGAVALLWNKLPPYIRSRVTIIFLRNDPGGAGWQQEHCVMAIATGGVTGQGYLQGSQTQRGIIPAQYTDEIFAVCGEELGLVGCAVMLLLLCAIILRCCWVGRHAASQMTALVAFGFGGMFLAQTVINIAMTLYVFPVVGLTLPFFSYGGTSIIILFAAAGLVSGVKAKDLPSWLQDRGSVL